MPDQAELMFQWCLDPALRGIDLNWLAIIGIERHFGSMPWFELALIGIGHWSGESWHYKQETQQSNSWYDINMLVQHPMVCRACLMQIVQGLMKWVENSYVLPRGIAWALTGHPDCWDERGIDCACIDYAVWRWGSWRMGWSPGVAVEPLSQRLVAACESQTGCRSLFQPWRRLERWWDAGPLDVGSGVLSWQHLSHIAHWCCHLCLEVLPLLLWGKTPNPDWCVEHVQKLRSLEEVMSCYFLCHTAHV